ncbi:MAG: pyruvate dehydrogenase complex dihydrolipoamide acetyltransferase [Alphaproteobacteria bacterium]|nr:pyruvate dehydrogenase complex dihydrolipoamide acetyltransferase [Alphaproteobacteria bacterium]MBP9777117.1 pyruvate dehydrogenase complex dihydrolipoamide acetyltransferase [Alphaproteobacteria bacterium]
MPIEILMPALSPTMTEGNLVKWHKKEGETVKAGDVIAEIETDKATMEVEAVDEGSLGKIIVPEGTEGVKVNQLIGLLLEEGEKASALETVKAETLPKPEKKEDSPLPSPETKTELKVIPHQTVVPQDSRMFATPLARRIAEKESLNLESITGSGPRGRIIKADVEQALTQGGMSRSSPPSALLSGYEPTYKVMPTSNIRKIIAKRLVEAKQTIPHFYLTVECEIDALLKAREQINKRAEGAYKLSVNDFVIKACGIALTRVPSANASWIEDQIYQYTSADVSVAVAIEGGLITPVIRQAGTRGLIEISHEMKALALRAREGKLKPEEFQGGTFSLSNLGMYGVKEFSAIINPPQGCILAVGMGEERPIVKKGVLTVATLMTCTLSVDHRVVDGAVGAQFLKVFKELIENPVMMIL